MRAPGVAGIQALARRLARGAHDIAARRRATGRLSVWISSLRKSGEKDRLAAIIDDIAAMGTPRDEGADPRQLVELGDAEAVEQDCEALVFDPLPQHRTPPVAPDQAFLGHLPTVRRRISVRWVT